MNKIVLLSLLFFSSLLFATTNQNRKTINVCTNPDWKPIEFTANGVPQGISIDIVNLMLQRLDIKAHYIKTSSWSESQRFLKEGKCDILPSAVKTAKREKYADFTVPYLSYDLLIVTNKDKPLVQNLDSIITKTMARRKGSGLISKLKAEYPNIKILETKDTASAFEAVQNDKVYFTVATLPVLSYYKSNYKLNDLQIAGNTNKNYNLCIAIRKGHPMLLKALNRELSHFSNNVKNIIFEKWARQKTKEQIDYSLVYKVVALFSLFLLIMLFRYIVIKRYNRTLEKKVEIAKKVLEKNQTQLLHQSRQAQMGEMINMIAHQWRQPLAAISATTTTINFKAQLNELDNDTAIELSDKISQYTQHLTKTIDDFREFFEPNREKKEVGFSQLVQSVLDIIQISIENKNITIEQELSCEDKFFTYPNEVTQVILNLMKNAEEVLLQREIEKPVIKIKSFKESSRCILEVSDNAGGVSEDVVGKIFDPYFSTKTKKDGNGLGLYISKTIIDEHCSGKLRVSNDAFGAVFRVELPLKDVDDKI